MKKILIVEDDKKIAQLEQAYLEMGGYETFCVYDGQMWKPRRKKISMT